MFIPIGTERDRKRPTVVTWWLIGLNVAAWLVQLSVMSGGEDTEGTLRGLRGAVDAAVLLPNDMEWWQLISYQFLHGDWMHILFNMLFLWVFGPSVEDKLGRIGFAGFYLIGGVVAGLVHMMFSSNPVIGASGSIAAVTGAFLVLFPMIGVRVLVFFFLIGVFTIPAWWFVCASIAYDMFYAAGGSTGVAHMAHIGGYVYGGAMAMTLLWFRILPREPFDLFSIGRQAHRRRRFKELTTKHSPWSHVPGGSDPVMKQERSRADEKQERISEQRIGVQRALMDGDVNTACDRYTALLDLEPEAALSRQAQLDLANGAFAEARYTVAAQAYERFLERHTNDAATNEVKLLLALVNARYLNDPVRAKQLLSELDPSELIERHAQIREELLSELG